MNALLRQTSASAAFLITLGALAGPPHTERSGAPVAAHHVHMRGDGPKKLVIQLQHLCVEFRRRMGLPTVPPITEALLPKSVHEMHIYYSADAQATYKHIDGYEQAEDCSFKRALPRDELTIGYRSGESLTVNFKKRRAMLTDSARQVISTLGPKGAEATFGPALKQWADFDTGEIKTMLGRQCHVVQSRGMAGKGSPTMCEYRGIRLKPPFSNGVMLEHIVPSIGETMTAYDAAFDTTVPAGVFAAPPGVRVEDLRGTEVEVAE